MDMVFDIFDKEVHLKYIEEWENRGELYSYLSHTRPRCLSENQESSESTKLFMIRHLNSYIGSAWLEDITLYDAKLGIYIAEPEFRGLGIGGKTIRYLINTAFEDLGLSRVYLNVRRNNERAISCYKKCGFDTSKEIEKVLPDGSSQWVSEMEIRK